MVIPHIPIDFVRLRQTQVTAGDSGDQEYIFKHVLTQETAYNSVLIAHRKVLHNKIGEAIEALFSERLEELSATLAYHFERGENPEKAVAYLHRAGASAVRLSANEDAVGHFRRALELLETLPNTRERADQELPLRVSLAVALTSHRGYADQEAERAYAPWIADLKAKFPRQFFHIIDSSVTSAFNIILKRNAQTFESEELIK